MAFKTSNKKGFTLIEILIAVMILAIISTLTAQNISRTTRYKKKIDQDIEDYSAVRDALIIITSDINKAFHWRDINEEVKKRIEAEAKANNKPSNLPQSNPNVGSTPIPTNLVTAFIGDEEKMHFTTLNNQRTIAESPESDQLKVGYYIKSVKSWRDQKSTKALVRSTSPILDEDVTRGGKDTILLENIKEFKLRYYGGADKDKEWVTEWKSTANEARTGERFPDSVEIIIETEKEGRNIKLTTVAAVHMPNNPQPTPTPGSAQQPNTPQTGTSK